MEFSIIAWLKCVTYRADRWWHKNTPKIFMMIVMMMVLIIAPFRWLPNCGIAWIKEIVNTSIHLGTTGTISWTSFPTMLFSWFKFSRFWINKWIINLNFNFDQYDSYEINHVNGKWHKWFTCHPKPSNTRGGIGTWDISITAHNIHNGYKWNSLFMVTVNNFV